MRHSKDTPAGLLQRAAVFLSRSLRSAYARRGRRAAALALSASLLVSQQGFLISEACAALVAPKIATPGAGTSAAAAGAAGGASRVAAVPAGGMSLTGGVPGTAALVRPETVSMQAPAPERGRAPFAQPPERLSAEGRALQSVDDVLRSAAPAVSPRAVAAAVENGMNMPRESKEADAPDGSGVRAVRRFASGLKNAPDLNEFFDGSFGRLDAETAPAEGRGAAGRRDSGLRPAAAPLEAGDGYAKIKEIKQILGEGTRDGKGWIEPFRFRTPAGEWRKSRTAGLEGFYYGKMELEAEFGEERVLGQLDDYFAYLDALLAPVSWTGGLREELRSIRLNAGTSPAKKNAILNAALSNAVRTLRFELAQADPSGWGRGAHTYAILSRAYNRLRPGKNFFDSLDEEELARIKDELKADQVWLLDIFEIGSIRRWGTGGGSPYAVKGYRRIKKELGGVQAFERFVRRAHKMGLKVRTDFIPNHTSLDSELVEKHPHAFLHLLPPQDLSDEEIMARTPRENHGPRSPLFYLVKTRSYPGREGRETKVLIHHPRTDYGDVMWIDMGQIDFSQPDARKWMVDQALHLFGEKGIDSIRRDMAYYVLNEGYYRRWLRILEDEKNSASAGWAREGMEGLIEGFKTRWGRVGGREILEEITDAVKRRHPRAVMDDEAYAYFTGLSRAGADGVYGKNTHDESLGQVGLYDALRSFDVGRIRAALKNNLFRFWQRGGATAVNFVGNHDEANPVDVFGRSFRAAAATALLGGPILTYNGFELGTGQKEMLGDLPGSTDKNKAIPFDVPVSIRWENVHPETRAFLRGLFSARKRNLDLFEQGAGEVLQPKSETPIVAWSAGRRVNGVQKALIVAANYHWDWVWGNFSLGKPALKDFGAFVPRADRSYRLVDAAHATEDGAPVVYVRTGKQLLEEGLFVHLAAGDAHVFEVEEFSPEGIRGSPPPSRLGASGAAREENGRAPSLPAGARGEVRAAASPALPVSAAPLEEPGRAAAEPVSSDLQVDKESGFWERLKRLKDGTWDDWTELLTNSAILAFLPLQVPQIIKNFGLITAGTLSQISILPWMGYSTGILGNMLLLSYFVSQKEAGAARVQAVGVLTSAVVVGQIFYAGFMPALAFWGIAPTIVVGLLLNYLNFRGAVNGTVWKLWNKALGLGGLTVLPLVLWATFMPQMSFWPAYVTAGTGLVFLILQSLGKLPKRLENVWSTLSAWTATMLFMFGPVAQLVNNFANPADIAGISLLTLFLAAAGNALMLPRAVLTKDRIWFTGSYWAVLVGGWAVLLSMLLYGAAPAWLFGAFSVFLPVFTAFIFRRAMKHHGETFRQAVRFLFRGE